MNSGNSFITLDAPTKFVNESEGLSDYTLNKCKRFNIKTIISTKILNNLSLKHKSYSIKKLYKNNVLYFADFEENLLDKNLFIPNSIKILYAIQTSGSTGKPKIVHVPECSIMPNIIDFMFVFNKILYLQFIN